MKLIIPMAGRGTRLRPHTLTTPKPLIPIAGKPIVQRLVEDLVSVCKEKVEEIVFIIGDFGAEVEKELLEIAASLNAKGTISHQEKALGTAHAVLCAGDALEGNIIVAFADTLFRADFTLDSDKDGIIWVKKVDNPSAFGVVKYDENNTITDFVEKPDDFVSDLAIIGIYYFKKGEELRKELQYLIDNDIKIKGEYGLTTALENMKQKGVKFIPGQVKDWLDCGNKASTVETNKTYLSYLKGKNELIDSSAHLINTTIIEPVFIGKNAKVSNSVIGPYVSIGDGTIIESSIAENSIIQASASIEKSIIKNSMIGKSAKIISSAKDVSIGDFCELKL